MKNQIKKRFMKVIVIHKKLKVQKNKNQVKQMNRL